MFRVKICGITSVADALAAADAGADAIGLNFYRPSRRCVSLAVAEQIVDVLPERVAAVGLFVNAPVQEVCQVADRLRLDVVQLHGDEPPEFIAQLGARRVMKAFRPVAQRLDDVWRYLSAAAAAGKPVDLALFDAAVAGQYGGTGQPADWEAARHFTRCGGPPLVLAGGLTPDNVSQAIHAARPAGVDTSSGVERAAGVKDHDKLRRFAAAAWEAFASLESLPSA